MISPKTPLSETQTGLEGLGDCDKDADGSNVTEDPRAGATVGDTGAGVGDGVGSAMIVGPGEVVGDCDDVAVGGIVGAGVIGAGVTGAGVVVPTTGVIVVVTGAVVVVGGLSTLSSQGGE